MNESSRRSARRDVDGVGAMEHSGSSPGRGAQGRGEDEGDQQRGGEEARVAGGAGRKEGGRRGARQGYEDGSSGTGAPASRRRAAAVRSKRSVTALVEASISVKSVARRVSSMGRGERGERRKSVHSLRA